MRARAAWWQVDTFDNPRTRRRFSKAGLLNVPPAVLLFRNRQVYAYKGLLEEDALVAFATETYAQQLSLHREQRQAKEALEAEVLALKEAQAVAEATEEGAAAVVELLVELAEKEAAINTLTSALIRSSFEVRCVRVDERGCFHPQCCTRNAPTSSASAPPGTPPSVASSRRVSWPSHPLPTQRVCTRR
jgi:hypothetical protein